MTSERNYLSGCPVQVLKFGEGNKFIVDDAGLDKIFLHPDVKNRKVVVFSIIGAFRKGKSFFLDYCLRFLYATYPSINNQDNNVRNTDWMGSEKLQLDGFSWRSGTKGDTTGIIMWSDVFLHTIAISGEKIAIIVMDTQGLFDNLTSPTDNSRIFALGTLLSSVQVLNSSQNIQEDQLQYLQFATEFAKFIKHDSHGAADKPFQNLLFLIRDWANPEEYAFGMEGGERFLKDVLEIKKEHSAELKSVRQGISASFEQLQCCLMPYPGNVVASSKKFDGRWSSMDKVFKNELETIVEKLFGPENLVLKKINGMEFTGQELKEYIQSCFSLFQCDNLPQTQYICEWTIDKQMSLLVEKCKDFYLQNVEKHMHQIESKQDLPTEDNLHIFHESSANKTLVMFMEEKKMGNPGHEKNYKAQLAAAMEKLYSEWRDRYIKSFQKIKDERRRTEEALIEVVALEQETVKTKQEVKEAQEELERQKSLKQIGDSTYEAKMKEINQRLETVNKQVEITQLLKDASQMLFQFVTVSHLLDKKI